MPEGMWTLFLHMQEKPMSLTQRLQRFRRSEFYRQKYVQVRGTSISERKDMISPGQGTSSEPPRGA